METFCVHTVVLHTHTSVCKLSRQEVEFKRAIQICATIPARLKQTVEPLEFKLINLIR